MEDEDIEQYDIEQYAIEFIAQNKNFVKLISDSSSMDELTEIYRKQVEADYDLAKKFGFNSTEEGSTALIDHYESMLK